MATIQYCISVFGIHLKHLPLLEYFGVREGGPQVSMSTSM